MDEDRVISYKIVVVGQSNVGKSALIRRFVDDQFMENYLATLGVDFKFRTFNLGRQTYKLQIWDTAGQEKYKTITKAYYKDSFGVILVFDLHSPSSFDQMRDVWFSEAKNNCDSDAVFMLLGNKKDLERKVDSQAVSQFCQQNGLIYGETSAKTGENVEQSFFQLTQEIKKRGK